MAIESNLAEAFNDCLNRLMAGEDIDQCLGQYPLLADELRALLNLAGRAVTATGTPTHVQIHNRNKFLAAGAKMRPRQPSRILAGWQMLSPVLGLGTSLAVVWLVFSLAINPILNQATQTPAPTQQFVATVQAGSPIASQTQTLTSTSTISPTVVQPSHTPAAQASATSRPATVTRVRPSVTPLPPSPTPLPSDTPTATDQVSPTATTNSGSNSFSGSQNNATQPAAPATETQKPDSQEHTPEPGDDHGDQSSTGDN